MASGQDSKELHMIPGHDEPSWRRELQTEKSQARKDSIHLTEIRRTWCRTVFRLTHSDILRYRPEIFHSSAFIRPVLFQYMSDLHLEVGQAYKSFSVPRAAPYLILAGDIGCLRDYKGFLDFLAVQCAQFDRVFIVLGNHEFYGISREDGLKAVASLEAEPLLLGKLSVLNRTRFDINRRVSILGCTLQSHIPEESKLWVRIKVAEFSRIQSWTVDDHNAEHLEDLKWLKQQISDITAQDPNRQIIIVTHHAPSFSNTTDPKHKSNPWSFAFCTELLESEVKLWHGAKNIRRWIFGHTHWNTEFKKHGIVVSSNQRGYLVPEQDAHGSSSSWMTRARNYFRSSIQGDFVPTKVVQV